MKKNELIRAQGTIYRILEMSEKQILLIDCIKQTMPVWMDAGIITETEPVTEDELCEMTDIKQPEPEAMSPEDRSIAHKRFTMISDILPAIGDKTERSKRINYSAAQSGMSTQSIRHYLCAFLIYQNITVLAPRKAIHERPLTQDEKNMRWGLNKFFYTSHKNSLNEAYTMLIKARYTDDKGKLLQAYPTFHQFRYFYRKTRKMQNYLISREGLKNYQRNHRPLTGDGVQEYADHVGVGMLDSTVCDIYLVNDAGQLVGRPLLTAAVDGHSGICMGYTLTWEGGVYSLQELAAAMIADKASLCRQHDIIIERKEWDCSQLPGLMVTDKGSEYISETFSQITELGITLVDLPSFRPELKGVVEKFFDVIQDYYKPHLKGKGVIEPDFQERGAHDYRKDACLTLEDFEKVIIRCILYYNNSRVIENYPFSEEMLELGIRPYARDIYEHGRNQVSADLIDVTYEQLMLTLLPRTVGTFTRYGLKVNKMRYHREGFTEEYLSGGDVTVAFNPDDVSVIWGIDKGEYIAFDLIEARFSGKTLSEVQSLQKRQRELVRSEAQENLQAKIDLAQHIQNIAAGKENDCSTGITGIIETRRKERERSHKNMMEVANG